MPRKMHFYTARWAPGNWPQAKRVACEAPHSTLRDAHGYLASRGTHRIIKLRHDAFFDIRPLRAACDSPAASCIPRQHNLHALAEKMRRDRSSPWGTHCRRQTHTSGERNTPMLTVHRLSRRGRTDDVARRAGVACASCAEPTTKASAACK